MNKYRIIDHPSDIGIEAFGKDKKELFVNAAFGMMDMMFELSGLDTEIKVLVKASANDPEALLISWLSELLYISDSKKLALSKFDIDILTDKDLEATVFGGKIVKIKRFIKAATFNQLKIAKVKDRYQARIVFDV